MARNPRRQDRVFFDGEVYWLADGFHRCHAAIAAGIEEIAAEAREGGRRDAILHAVGANATHGRPRTNEDRRRAVLMLLGGFRQVSRHHPSLTRAGLTIWPALTIAGWTGCGA